MNLPLQVVLHQRDAVLLCERWAGCVLRNPLRQTAEIGGWDTRSGAANRCTKIGLIGFIGCCG